MNEQKVTAILLPQPDRHFSLQLKARDWMPHLAATYEDAEISMRLGAFSKFSANFQLAGSFHLRNGVLIKVDLVQAASNSGKTNAREARPDLMI